MNDQMNELISDIVEAAASTLSPTMQVVFYTVLSGVVWVLNLFKRTAKFALAAPVRIVGAAGWLTVLWALAMTASIVFGERWLMYTLTLLMLLAVMLMRAIVVLLKQGAALMHSVIPQFLTKWGIDLTKINLGVWEMLVDISMCLLMCSSFILDGPGIGIMPPSIVWASLSTLVALVLVVPSSFKIRRILMAIATTCFTMLNVFYWAFPGMRSVLAAFYELTQYAQEFTAAWLRDFMGVTNKTALLTLGIFSILVLLGVFVYIIVKVAGAFVSKDETEHRHSESANTHGAADVAPAEQPNKAEHGDHHGGHQVSGFPWNTVWTVIGVLAVVSVLLYAGSRLNSVTVSAASAVPASSAVSATASFSSHAVTIPFSSSFPPPQDFQVISTSDNSGEFLLDARVIWQELPLLVSEGDTINWTAQGEGCQEGTDGKGCNCIDANGFDLPGMDPWAKDSMVKPEQYAVGDAYLGELVMDVGGKQFQAGPIHKHQYIVPHGVVAQPIKLMLNTRLPFIGHSSGGPTVTVNIDRKK